jgi:monoamine oxidase
MKTVIVGGGIAGLYVADKMIAAGVPGSSITIVEQNGHVGGRIITSKKHHVEIGAGRIHRTHRRVLSLLKRFDIPLIPVRGASAFRDSKRKETRENAFELAWPSYIELLAALPPKVLATNTLRQLLTRILDRTEADKLLIEFPYRAEVDYMRADIALHSFNHTEASLASNEGYFVVKGGLSTLVDALATHLAAAGVIIRLNTTVTDVKGHTVLLGATAPLDADRVILALPVVALHSLPVIRSNPLLDLVGMSPLTRIYATYPSTSWFGRQRLVTDSPLRYIIPVSATTLMISYTDGQDTKTFRGLKALQKAIQTELRRLFPEKEIPEPTWIQAYEWSEGTSFWKPGTYDPAAASKAILQPIKSMPSLFVCGESFSLKQAWIEGALEHAELLWTTHLE